MYYSEYGQDRWLVENVFGGEMSGVFVEAGALDGIGDSNTLFFERERDWLGVLIEPNPTLLESLTANRPLAAVVGCALSSTDGFADFDVVLGALRGWSGLTATANRRREVPYVTTLVRARPLAAVLHEHEVVSVDYLSLDVEGAEFDVLSVYPFDAIPIRVIGVEDNNADNRALRELLLGRGYEYLARVGVDEFWRLSDGS